MNPMPFQRKKEYADVAHSAKTVENGVTEEIPDADEGATFFGNPLVRSLIAASSAIILFSFAAIYLFVIRGASGTIVLHFNVYFGVDIVGNPWQALLIPAMSLLFLLLNIGLAYRFYVVRERVAAHILLFAAFLSALSAGVVTAALSFINS
ncbi:MAG: hypothetical protein HGB37_01630 [Candidatus Moranbacteria bacterium]|jgi:hypothetical protein|nr:hypothetical protein [Candidatus Moranbacteria bacterium]